MIQGTGSGVGKSIITAAFCRIFVQDGYNVAPFKAQNMALNSFVTPDGGEIGRAQAVQALASRVRPTVDMNPVLMKPSSDRCAQIIVHGKPIGNLSAVRYASGKQKLFTKVTGSLDRLRSKHEIVVIEGAGSPAEVNLKENDIVNMSIAEYSRTPVIIVGDIDKGGVLAWLVGTLELLTESERRLVKGIIINKFRGDKRLFAGGVSYLEHKTGVKALGIIPYLHDLAVAEEDSVPLEAKRCFQRNRKDAIKAAVIYLPHISNFTDFDALQYEPDICLKYVKTPEELDHADIIIIPGTKNTIGDLQWLKSSGLADKILAASLSSLTTIVGICGGYQMLGTEIQDKHCLESKKGRVKGLFLLPVITRLQKNKYLRQVRAKEISTGLEVQGYEIHHGKTISVSGGSPVFKFTHGSSGFDGTMANNNQIWGTYIHGVFDSHGFRRSFLNSLRIRKRLHPLAVSPYNQEDGINTLAKIVRKNIDLNAVYKILKACA